MLAVGGWLASTRVGPASVDWESVPPLKAPAAILTRSPGEQKWWVVARNDSAATLADGGGPVRLEFRLLMSPGQVDTARYVVSISVDGKAEGWEAFTATPDPRVSMPGVVVGDRDRVEFALPRGRHLIRVGLMAGSGDRLLFRVRRPE